MEVDYDEDETVVFEGSDMYKILKEFSCDTFEVCSLPKKSDESIDDVPSGLSYLRHYVWKYCDYLFSGVTFYGSLTTVGLVDGDFNSKQCQQILKSNSLLDDHRWNIQSYLKECKTQRSGLLYWPMVSLASYAVLSAKNRWLAVCILLPISLSFHVRFVQHMALGNLNNLVATQNKLHALFVKSLHIFRHSRFLRANSRGHEHNVNDLTARKYKCLRNLLERFVGCMCYICNVYRWTSTEIERLAVDGKTIEVEERFESSREICYESLKKWYYAYVVAQSDTLHLLADTYLTKRGYQLELQLEHIICCLTKALQCCEKHMTKVVEEYEGCKGEPTKRAIKNSKIGSKWQHLYSHLDITLRKVSVAYDSIVSVLESIDDYPVENSDGEETITSLSEKVNAMYEAIEEAKSFAEYGRLLVTSERKEKEPSELPLPELTKQETAVETTGETIPVIVDEVFEEYIREEYLKPFYEEMLTEIDDLSSRGKFDALLVKNFTSELKEVLIEKRKAMEERETKAFRRSKGYVERSVPTPPPMPDSPKSKVKEPIKPEFNFKLEDVNDSLAFSLPRFNISSLPMPRLGMQEETFVGSGENSEEEDIINEE